MPSLPNAGKAWLESAALQTLRLRSPGRRLRNDDTQTQLRGRCDTVSEGGIGVMLAGELELGER